MTQEIREYEEALQRRRHLEMERSDAEAKFKEEIPAQRKLQFLTKYGDYYSSICLQLRGTAGAFNTEYKTELESSRD